MYLRRTGRDPLRDEFDRLRREVDGLFNVFSSERKPWHSPPWQGTRLFPLLNVSETGDSFIVSAEIPGMQTDDLEIKIEGETLTLKGERKPDDVEDEASFHRRERATGAFQRSLTVPGKIDAEKVNARYKNGVLTVTLAKDKPAQPRQITVEAD